MFWPGHDGMHPASIGAELAQDLLWIQWGVAGRPMHLDDESGDQGLIQPFPGGVLAAVVDGLGHGARAAEAAGLAIRTLADGADEPLDLLFQRCHEALAATRGAVMSLASFDARAARMTWLGVGNVAGVLRRSNPGAGPVYDWLLLRGGIVGQQLPALHPSTLYLGEGDTVILATDGVGSSFATRLDWHASPQQIADRILIRDGRGTDDALAITVRYVGGEEGNRMPGVELLPR